MTRSASARALVAALVCLLALLGLAPAASAAPPNPRSNVSALPRPGIVTNGDVRMWMTSGAPATATTGSGTTVSVIVENTGDTPIDGATLRARVGTRPLDSLAAQQRWEEGKLPLGASASADADVPTIMPGTSETVKLSLTSSELDLSYTMATLPLRIELRGAGRPTTRLHSFVSWAAKDATFTRMSASVVVPVTLPNDPKLLTATGEERLEAWRKAIGPGSTIERLITSDPGVPVTWLIDPAVLDPAAAQDGTLPTAEQETTQESPASPSASPTSDGTSSPSESASGSASPSSEGSTESNSSGTSEPSESSESTDSADSGSTSPGTQPSEPAASVDELAANLRAKLAERPGNQSIAFTPYGDPDLSALTSARRPAGSQKILERSLSRPLSSELSELSETVVAAPVAPLDAGSTARLTAAWQKTRGSRPVVLTPNVSLDRTDVAAVTSATRRTTNQVTMVGYNAPLSRTLNDASMSNAEAAASLRASSLAIYQQQPTAERSLVIMGGRETVTVGRLKAIASALEQAPWVQPAALSTEESTSAPVVDLAPQAPPSETVWPRVAAPAFDAGDITTADRTLATLTKMAEIVVDGDDIVPAWTRNLDQVTSTRWRGDPADVDGLVEHASSTVSAIPQQIAVVPSRVNFFSDSGPISVTVKNGLARAVHGIEVNLTPRTYAVRFRSQPDAVDIPGKGQTSVRVPTVAQAAGRVSVDAKVTGPGDVRLGESDKHGAEIEINARPTGTWIFWVLGIVALLVFCYGLVRNRQKGTRRRDELARDIQL